tara:strand:+ start:805 stop:990 length:186 start_codon:yes stop_codon:yes gene_type:complete
MTTQQQMKQREEKIAYEKAYKFWSARSFDFRVLTFKIVDEQEAYSDIKSPMWKALNDLTPE